MKLRLEFVNTDNVKVSIFPGNQYFPILYKLDNSQVSHGLYLPLEYLQSHEF